MIADRWSLEESTAPASEPLSTPDAKDWLRVDDADDDLMIPDLVRAARIMFEQQTNRSLINTVWKLRLDEFPSGTNPIKLPRAPVSVVTSVQYQDGDDATQTWASTNYEVDLFDNVTTIRPADAVTYPATNAGIQAVTVTFTAGYGADQTTVPQDILTTIKLILTSIYEHRDPMLVGTSFQEFPTLERLVWPHKVWL